MTASGSTRCSDRPRPHIVPGDKRVAESESSARLQPDRLQTAICKALCESGYGALCGVEVHIDSGTVTLKGRVPNFYQKQIATSLVMPMEGVDELNNDLHVTPRRAAHNLRT
ncbi:MAG: BON domain-containing protein [Planctomycetota bacterium]|jgi:osmotically-inducible protein OsmY